MVREPTLTGIFVLAAVATAGAALATILPIDPPTSPSVIFLDDFEDGGLTVDDLPPGRWSGLDSVPGTDAGVSPAAVRAGARGLRIVDTTDLPAVGTTVAPYAIVGPASGDRYARLWVRVDPTSDAGVFTLLQLLYGSRSTVDVNVAFPPGAFLLAGDRADGGYLVTPTGIQTQRLWHLVEVGLVDAGTASVTRTLWIDTAFAAQQRVNQLGWTVDELDVGEPWSDDGQFQGTIDLDGVAVTTDPPPSHVEVDAGALALAAGQCAPLSGRLMSSSGVPAGALRPDRLYLTVTGGPVALFTDPDCADAGSTLDIDAGTVDVAFGILALSAATLNVYVDSFDLYGYPIDVAVTAPADAGAADSGVVTGEDAGADAGTGAGTDGGEDAGHDAGDPARMQDLSVCGCGATGTSAAAAAAALVGLALARRRRRAQADCCTGAAAGSAGAR